MKYYNIYYKGIKINNRPLTEEDAAIIKNETSIRKKNIITNKIELIPVDQIKFVNTIII